MRKSRAILGRIVAIGFVVTIWVSSTRAEACPFCRPISTTFAQEIEGSDVAALAELVSRPDRPDPDEGQLPTAELVDAYRATFRITKVLKGKELVTIGQKVVAIYTGDSEIGATFLMRGVEPSALQWAPPLDLSERAQNYVQSVLKLPEEPAERLRFFQNHLDDEEETLRNDAYDEFARADYDALKAIKDDIDRERLIGWIKDPETTPSSRGLYFTMLSVCGRPEDAKMLAEMFTSGDSKKMSALASMISCYLNLVGSDGLTLIEDHFLRGGFFWDPEYVHTYGAITALRFHGQSEDKIPRPRLLQSLRIMLDRPQLADLVIPDLARWEDWDSMDQLVTLFKEANKESSWVRVPIVNYLRACPKPEARDHLKELSKIDPDAVRRASSLFPYAPASTAAAEATPKDQDPAGDTPESVSPPLAADKTEDPAAKKDEPANSEVADAAAPAVAEAAGTRPWWLVAAPVAAAVILFGLMWLILRRPREPVPTQNA